MADGQFIVGDGSGGGGGGSYGGAGGAGGAGGGDNDTLTGSAYNDVIFGDGSGGGGGESGGSGHGAGGAGGDGADSLYGGDGNDILFGDGFNGSWVGQGGFGGGGGGGGNSSVGGAEPGGLGAGSGSNSTSSGGNSTVTDGGASSNGGAGYYFAFLGAGAGGGGGGFGDTGNGGAGSKYGTGGTGSAGGTSQYTLTDSGGSIYNTAYNDVTAGNIYNTGTTNQGTGAGSDLLDGGAGSDHYFGMGGADTYVVSAQDNAATDADTVWDFNRTDGDQIQLEDTSGNVIDAGGIDTLLASADTSSGDTVITLSDGSTVTIKGVTDLTSADFDTACFLPGTQFETADGMKAIEDLKIGDLLRTNDGFKPLKWLAHRAVRWDMSIPRRVAPVLIKQGALGNGLPQRDLYVSPAHALLMDGVLVQAELLVNGSTIVQLLDHAQDFSYWNIELDEHAIVFAEGAAVESYLEVGDNRRSYDNAAQFHTLYPQHRPSAALDLGRITLRRQLPLHLSAMTTAAQPPLAAAA